MTTEGMTYERAAIEQHFHQQRAKGMFVFMTSPITDAILADTQLIPNAALKCVIDEWREQQAQQDGGGGEFMMTHDESLRERKVKTTTKASSEICGGRRPEGMVRHPKGAPLASATVQTYRIPTLAIGAVYNARKALHAEFKVDIEIERDDMAVELGVRQVVVPDSPSSEMIRARLWSIVQKQSRGKTLVFDTDTGLPYAQITFPVDSINYKIGKILSREEKMKIQNKFKVNFLVERLSIVHATRTVILTAWIATHGQHKVADALNACRDYILSQLE